MIGKILINKKSVYPEGQKYLDSAIVICNQHNYQKHKALALFYFASSLLKQSIYDKALAQNIEAFEIRKKIKDCQNLASSYNSIANLHIKIGKSKESLKYYKEGVKHSEAHKNTLLLPTIYQNIGSAFNNINKDSAKFYLQKAINASKAIKDEHALAYATFNLADINADMGHYKKARAGMFEAMRIFEKIDETSNVGWVLPCIAQLDLKHFEEKKIAISQQQFNESNEMLKKALDLNANGNNYETLIFMIRTFVWASSKGITDLLPKIKVNYWH